MICPICGSPQTSPWSERIWLFPVNQKEFRYRNCPECGTIFSDPLPEVRELKAYYLEHFNYKWYEEHLPFKRMQAAHRWQRMAPVFSRYGIQPGRLLDIGCGHGLFVAQAKKGGWSALGMDYPSLATRHARETLHLEIIEGDLRRVVSEGRAGERSFDFITAWHCLEHDTDPLSCLTSIAKLLSPQGKVLIAVPNAEAFGVSRRKEDWVWCQEPFVHLVHFTDRSLRQLAGKAGLKVLESWTRDTWDAHPAFDVYAAPHVKRLARFLRRFSGRAAFWVEEGARLACYFLGCHQHWLNGKECAGMKGSELLLVAEAADCNGSSHGE